MVEINIKTLARQLNLSIATVSKALRDSHEISVVTKERVLALAHELNYTPNPYASSLRRKKSNTIAVVVPEVADSFFSQALKGIESIAQNKGYHVLVYLTYESFRKEKSILNDFKSGRVDGVLMSLSSETSNYLHLTSLSNRNTPIVFFDRVPAEMETVKITTNDFESCYQAAQHLMQRGCRHIAFLSISEHLSINNKRKDGFLQALKDHIREEVVSTIISCSNDAEQNFIALHKIMLQKNRPDGIIASVEKLTSTVYLVCKKIKINIPKQLKVVSFSNLETAPILAPSLTTVTQPAFEMGRTAATILFKTLSKKNYGLKNESITIPSALIIRESTS
jgi:LacI family transcriptional regulator